MPQHICETQQLRPPLRHSGSTMYPPNSAPHISKKTIGNPPGGNSDPHTTHKHQTLWLHNAPPSATNRQATPNKTLQQLKERTASCGKSGTYLGTDHLHVMATMIHPQGIRIVNYRFDRLCFDQLTPIHHLDYTNPNPNNASQLSLLNPQDIRPNDIVIYNAQPGLHWEACPLMPGGHPVLGESFTGNDEVITLPRHPPPNISGDNDRPQGTPTQPAKRKLDFHTQHFPPSADNPNSHPTLDSRVTTQLSPAAAGCSSDTRLTRPRLPPATLPMPPPELSSHPPSLDDSARAKNDRQTTTHRTTRHGGPRLQPLPLPLP